VIQKGSDVVFIEATGMGRVVDADEANDPAHVRLLCVIGVLAASTDLPHLIEKFGGLIAGVLHRGDVTAAKMCGLKIRLLILSISKY
jgi:hypothetical protein